MSDKIPKEKKKVTHSPVDRKRKNYLLKMSDEEIQEMMDSIPTDPESDDDNDSTGKSDDDDDSVKDPNYQVLSGDEVEIDDCTVESRSLSANFLSKAIHLSLNLSNISSPLPDPTLPSTSIEQQQQQQEGPFIEAGPSHQAGPSPQAQASSMPAPAPIDHLRLKGRRAKRRRSPLPEQEEGGPDIQPNDGGFTQKTWLISTPNPQNLIK